MILQENIFIYCIYRKWDCFWLLNFVDILWNWNLLNQLKLSFYERKTDLEVFTVNGEVDLKHLVIASYTLTNISIIMHHWFIFL